MSTSTNTADAFTVDPEPIVTDDLIEDIAETANADTRAVLRVLVGLPVRRSARNRIVSAIAALCTQQVAA